jgi:hypothetical protein
MRSYALMILSVSVIFFAGLYSQAGNTFPVTNKVDNVEHTFTNTLGTALLEDGMIVFEGELVADMPVAAAYTNNKLLASVQLVVQIKLFDELPGATDVGENVQGAVLALNDAPENPDSTTGTFYAYGTNGWGQLTNSVTSEPYATYENKTNIVTMIFDYTDSDAITYRVDVGNPTPSGQLSQTITSPATSKTGINSIALSGIGALDVGGLAAVGGSPVPLSLGMSLSVYYASNTVWATVNTVSENGHDPIRIHAKIGGAWVLVGSVDKPYGEGDHAYTVPLSGLVPGESYMFKIEDEESRTFFIPEPLQVQVIQIGETAVETWMEMQMLSVVFNSKPGKRYQVKISESLGAAASWTVENNVYINGGFTNEFTAVGEQTQIRIPVNKNKAFFRIFMLKD